MTNRKQLKDNADLPHTLFINDDLTKARSKIAAKCRQLLKDKKINGTWVKAGVIFVKNKSDKLVKISKLSKYSIYVETIPAFTTD